MKAKRSFGLVLGLVLLCGIGVLAWEPGAGVRPALDGDPGTIDPDGNGRAAAPSLELGGKPGADPASPPREGGRVASELPDSVPAGRPRIPIELHIPPGTPADESVDLVLRARAEAGQGPGSRHGNSEPWNEVARIVDAGPGQQLSLPVPEGVGTLRIELDAHYLYLARPIDVPVRETYDPVPVRPELGGRVRFRLATPNPAASGQDPKVLAGSKAYLEDRPKDLFMVGNRFPTTVHVDEDLVVDCRGQAADHIISIYGTKAPFAPYRSESVQPSPGMTLDIDVQVLAGLELHGRVVGPGGERVEGAFLWVTTKSATGTSGSRRELDEAGEFHLRGVHPNLSHIVAKGGGFLPADMHRADMPPGPVIEGIELRMREGSAITGRVLLPDGRPASGVALSLHPPGKEEWPKGQTRTDGEGRFRFGNLDEVSMVLSARANFDSPLPTDVGVVPATGAGSLGWRATAEASTGDDVELHLVAPVALRGRAFDDGGGPIPTVTLKARRDTGLVRNSHALFFTSEGSRVETQGGEFTWTALTPGRWLVGASAPGFAEIDPIRVEVPSEDPMEFTFFRKRPIRGRVVDGSGRGLEGAKVAAYELHGGRDTRGGVTGTTDAEGGFEVSGVPMIYRIHAELAGWAPSERVDVDSRELGEGDRLTLVLRRGGRVECELVDASGEAVPKRTLSLISSDDEPYANRGTETDGAGRAVFEDVLPGDYVLRAELVEGEGRARRVEESIQVRGGGTVRVSLGGARVTAVEVAGRLSSGGRPLPKYTLTFDPEAPGASRVSVETGADGTYRARLEAGGPTRITYGSSTGPRRVRWEELPLEGEHRIDLELPGSGIRGTLVSSDGALPFSPRVFLTPLFRIEGLEYASRIPLRLSGGRHFAGSELPPGAYILTATPDPFFAGTANSRPASGATRQVELVAGETLEGLELELGEPCVLEVEVVDEMGAPYLGAAIHAVGVFGNPLHTRPLACSGSTASITIFPPGDVILEARSKTHVSGVRESVRLVPGTVTRATLIVQEGGSARVRLPEGDSVSPGGVLTAGVRLGCEYGQVIERSWPTSGDRELLLGPMAPGPWSLTFHPAEGESSNQDFEVRAGEEVELELALTE